jgi:hypothetical protein
VHEEAEPGLKYITPPDREYEVSESNVHCKKVKEELSTVS